MRHELPSSTTKNKKSVSKFHFTPVGCTNIPVLARHYGTPAHYATSYPAGAASRSCVAEHVAFQRPSTQPQPQRVTNLLHPLNPPLLLILRVLLLVQVLLLAALWVTLLVTCWCLLWGVKLMELWVLQGCA